MAADGTKAIKGGKTQGPSQEEIIHGFNQLRNEQRQLISKVSELEAEQNEHKLVIETLDEVEESRKCFRLVGGVLVERTVKEVLPALVHNKEQLTKTIELLNKQVASKGLDINSYKEKHNIQVRGGDFQNKNKEEAKEEKSTNSQGVLVESKS
nr:EOG090X0L97 [Lepidurus arcticus]